MPWSTSAAARSCDASTLLGLDLAGIDQLLQSAGAATDDDLLARVKLRTGGNPFFVSELLRLLPTERARAEARTAEAVASGRGVPDSVKGVIQRRVAGLPEASRATLEVAATLGQDFDLAVLAAAVDADGATLLDQLEPALDAGSSSTTPGAPPATASRTAW